MRSVLEEMLLRARVTDEKRLRKGNDIVMETGCTLAHAMVKLGLLSDRALAQLIASTLNLRVVDPTRLSIHDNALGALTGTRAYQLRALPIRLRSTANGEFIYVAMSDPTDQDAVREIEATTGRELVPAVSEEKALEKALHKHYGGERLAHAHAQVRDDRPPPLQPVDLPADPPVVVGAVLEEAAAFLAPSLAGDDDGYFSESTEELVTIYSRARMKVGADDDDMAWLARRQSEAGAAPVRGAAASAPQAHDAPTTPIKAVSLPLESVDEATRETPVTPAMRRAVQAAAGIAGDAGGNAPAADGDGDGFDDFAQTSADQQLETPSQDLAPPLRVPTCVVVEDKRKRAWLRAQLKQKVARLHMEESLGLARKLGGRVPMGYVVVVDPTPTPTISIQLERLKEIAGSPKVIVVGGEASFQIVPGVDAWIDAPELMALPDAIVKVLRQYDSIG